MLSYTPSPKEPRALGLGPPGHCSTLQRTATNVQTDNLAQQEKVNCVYSVLRSILFPLSACPHSELQGGPPPREWGCPRCPRREGSHPRFSVNSALDTEEGRCQHSTGHTTQENLPKCARHANTAIKEEINNG